MKTKEVSQKDRVIMDVVKADIDIQLEAGRACEEVR